MQPSWATLCQCACACALLTLTLACFGQDGSGEADITAAGGTGSLATTAGEAGLGGSEEQLAGASSIPTDTTALPGQENLLGDECWAHSDCESGVCWTWSSVDSACLGNMCSLACQADQECAEAAEQIKARKPEDRRILGAGDSSAATCESTGCDFSLVFSFHSCA